MRAALACVCLCVTATAWAETTELRNDSWENGSALFFQMGFVAGESAAVRLTPEGVGPYRIDYIYFPYGPDAVARDVDIEVYDDGGDLEPSASLFAATYSATGSTTEAAAYNLGGEDIQVDGAFRIRVGFTGDGAPCISRDASGNGGDNFIHSGGVWYDSAAFLVPGDWIIRAGVTDLGAADAPPPTTSDPDSMKGGCSSAADSGGAELLLGLAIAFGLHSARERQKI